MADDVSSLSRLRERFADLDRACVAFSGGVDSSVVLAAAALALGPENVVAFTATSPVFIAGELETAAQTAARLGVEHAVVATHQLDDAGFAANARDRCYVCKAGLLEEMAKVAAQHGCAALIDGANADDVHDDRPGMTAAAERGVGHPLLEAGIGKEEVRRLARELGLPARDAPQQACLASRVPYGEPITAAKLAAVAAAEAGLRELGFRQCRVRHHGVVGRVEVETAELGRALDLREEIVARVRAAGFTYAALDLSGFRSGSMNEA